MDEIAIKKIDLTSLDALTTMARKTFVDAFGPLNTKENMDSYLSASLSRDHLQTELVNPASHFYFAYQEDVLAGYLKMNVGAAQNEPFGEEWMELERIYVTKEFQGRGLGKELVKFTLQQARSLHKKIVWLGVWEHNSAAQRLYTNFGFVAFDSHDFMLGTDLQTDILMKLHLDS